MKKERKSLEFLRENSVWNYQEYPSFSLIKEVFVINKPIPEVVLAVWENPINKTNCFTDEYDELLKIENAKKYKQKEISLDLITSILEKYKSISENITEHTNSFDGALSTLRLQINNNKNKLSWTDEQENEFTILAKKDLEFFIRYSKGLI